MPLAHFAPSEHIPPELAEGVAALRQRLGVPDAFSPDVVEEAERAVAQHALPDLDRTDLPFLTIDPEGSKDLDQAMHLERVGDGYRVFYAIADVASFVRPGGALDVECHARGETLYAPSVRTPLHPPVMSEGAASLLPGQVCSALLWTIDLDAAGAQTSARVERARVMSREQLTYPGVQAALDAGTASMELQLLREIGQLRQAQERARGGVSLQVPEQEVVERGGSWALEFRQTLPVEDWNAQISLLTGGAAARMMLEGGIGILRTLPPAQDADLARLRRIAAALELPWPPEQSYADFVPTVDPGTPRGAAMLTACTRLFRGAGYAAFDGAAPEQPLHAALAMPYAHCTAPLRRLVDRYAGEVCLALSAGVEVPSWVRAALPLLPAEMAAADARAKKYERGIVDLVEALVLSKRVGEVLTGSVVDVDAKGGAMLQLTDPAVTARVKGVFELGSQARVRLVGVDLLEGSVSFEPA